MKWPAFIVWVVSVAFSASTATANYFNLAGQLLASTDANGNTTLYGYDAAGRSVAVTNALGQVSRSFYDASGNLTNSIDALGRSTKFVYDQLNRRVQTIFADGTTQQTWFDALGRRTYEQDQAGKVTAFGYDTLGRMTAVTNALGYVTSYGYDEMGNLIRQTDANNHTTTFEYDSMGRRLKRTLPGNQVETYAYDLAGNLTNKVDFNGHATSYAYDSVNRLLTKTPDAAFSAPPVTMTYTATGQRATMSDAGGTTTYYYNSRDWLTNKAVRFYIPGGARYTSVLGYNYDLHGNVTHISSSDPNGVDLGYTYDPLNRLENVTDTQTGTTTYGYDSVGNLAGYVYPNNVSSTYAYDSLNRLTNLMSANAQLAPVAFYRYTVAAGGQRLTAAENVVLTNGVRTINRLYSYDATYRLTHEGLSVTDPVALPATAGVGYTLDDVGNRLARQSTLNSVLSTSSSFDANDRLTSDTYDANGNTVSGHVITTAPAVSDQYDFEDRLINRNNGQITLTYDGDGNRVSKTIGGVTTLYLVDDRNPSGYAQVLEEETTTGGTPVVTRVYAYGHSLISQDQFNGSTWLTSFYGTDGHGNVRYLTDTAGNLTDTYDYDAFGNLIAQTGSTANSYLYCGEQFDSDLGLYYNRARYLNPDEGRFWSQDKYDGDSEDPLSLHNYLYGNPSPVIELDPTGYETIAETEYAQEIGARLEANGIVNTARARQIVSYVCKGATAIDAAAQGISGVYIIVGIEETYVGSSINILTRLAGHSGKVGSLIAEVGEGAITKTPVDLGAAGEFGLSEGGLLRTVEQRFLQDMTPGGIGSNGNLNKIRARAFKKFDAFVKSFCPGGVLK